MKVKEFLKGLNLKDCYGIYSADKEILKRYYDVESIVAYDLNKLGSIFIFKGKRSNFGFFKLADDLGGYLFNRTICRRISLNIAVKLLGKCKVVDKKEFKKIKRKVILEKLK